jgi:hypothetical protein
VDALAGSGFNGEAREPEVKRDKRNGRPDE